MNDLELAVRTIENILPDLSNKKLQKWHSILSTALIKIEEEIQSTKIHLCSVCGFEEYGYRTELPISWREKGDIVICFNHRDNEIAELLKNALEVDKKQAEATTEKTLEELMSLI